jgi:hypothetical protein
MARGTVWSFSPETISNGPRSGFSVSTLASVQGLRLAVAAWNSGAPEAGTAYASYSCFASSSETALAKAYSIAWPVRWASAAKAASVSARRTTIFGQHG